MKGFTDDMCRRHYRIKGWKNVLNIIEKVDGTGLDLRIQSGHNERFFACRLSNDKVKKLHKLLGAYLENGALPVPKEQEPLKEGKIY
jgi:hypothetical protein